MVVDCVRNHLKPPSRTGPVAFFISPPSDLVTTAAMTGSRKVGASAGQPSQTRSLVALSLPALTVIARSQHPVWLWSGALSPSRAHARGGVHTTMGATVAMSNLRADLEEARRAKPATFAAWLETADPETRDLVMEYILDTAVMVDPLVAKLRKNDIPITRETVEKYRDSR